MDSQPPPSVGVVVLNWNGWRDTLQCLASLAAARPGPAQVLVVDNGSTDDSVARLRERGRGNGEGGTVELVESATNLGFAGGNNLGLAHLAPDSRLTHFLLLNNDATVAPDYFAELARALEAAPDAGLLSGTVYYAAAPSRVWYAGGRLRPLRASVRHHESAPDGGHPRPTDFVSGCAMVISRRAVEAVGPLPECYFPMYWEDAEYSLKVRAARLPVLYAPRARAYHRVTASASTPPLSLTYAYAYHRNRGWFVRRNLEGATRLGAFAYLTAAKSVECIWATITGHPRMGWATVAGTLAGLFGPEPRG